MAGRHVRRRGLSLVEMLIALAIFTTVLALAGGGIVQVMGVQSLNEASTSLQAKLRRVAEVVAQDLRSAVYGSLMAHPYPSGATSISFALADGGSGFAVFNSGGASFPNRNNADVYVPASDAAATGLQGRRALMVNASGDGIEFRITNVQEVGGAGSQRFNFVHAGCNNTIAFEPPVTLTQVQTLGFSFDASSGELRRTVADGVERVLAYDLSDFRIEYVYEGSNGATEVRDAPLLDGGRPLRQGVIGGVPHTLASLRVTVVARERLSGRSVERSYVSQIALPTAGTIQVRSVVSCP